MFEPTQFMRHYFQLFFIHRNLNVFNMSFNFENMAKHLCLFLASIFLNDNFAHNNYMFHTNHKAEKHILSPSMSLEECTSY